MTTGKKTPSSSSGRWPGWYGELAAYQGPRSLKTAWQLCNTLIPYGVVVALMLISLQRGYPYWLTLLLSLPAAALLVRTFILFHDCVHSSLFASRTGNAVWGHILGVLTFTSFEDWKYSHLRHHATYANLDNRGIGDIWVMTLKEYQAASPRERFKYRLYRNPIILFGLGPLFIFVIGNRFPTSGGKRKELMSVLLTDLLIAVLFVVFIQVFGWRALVLVQLPIIWIAGIGGIWLFYMQHQFDKGYWARAEDWDPVRAAMEGSSFYNLPGILRWFSGNIGYHHIHHLKPRIPNYHLKKCYETIQPLHGASTFSLLNSLSCMRLKLWDEDQQKMIPFPGDSSPGEPLS